MRIAQISFNYDALAEVVDVNADKVKVLKQKNDMRLSKCREYQRKYNAIKIRKMGVAENNE